MSYQEDDIKFEGKVYWVLKEGMKYKVFQKGLHHSESTECYSDESIAIARAKYLDNKISRSK